jgi:hypothetical protein
MGYGYYTVGHDNRPAGYLVLATCDAFRCDEEIDRGLGYLCGDSPHDLWSDERGCGRYFCGKHLSWIGGRGGCKHRRNKAHGKVLSDLVPNEDGSVVCCDRQGHEGPHAWAAAFPANSRSPGVAQSQISATGVLPVA